MFEKYDAYKDSGVEWLGEIPQNWEVKPLKYGAKIVLGKMLCPEDKGGYFLKPYLKSKNIQWLKVDISSVEKMWFSKKEMSLYQLQRGDLILSEGGEVGKVCIWDNELEECYIQNSAHKVSMSGSSDSKYHLYQMFAFGQRKLFDSIVNRVSIAHLTREKLSSIKFIFPNLSEQKQIVKFLDQKTSEIDQAIAIKEQQIALLNERKQIVIQKAVTQGLDQNPPMKDSGVEWIGQIPAHWNTITKLKHIASLKGRQGWQGLKADEYIDEGPYVVSSAHFEGLDINWDKCPHVSRERYEMDSHIQLNIADILLMKDGAKMGKMAYISNLPDLACLNSHLLLIRSLKTQDEFFFESKYMLYFMLSEKFQDYVQVKGTGTTFMGISQESIGNFPIALPSLYEQIQIASFLDQKMLELEKGKDLLLTQIAKLKEYKTTLINDAVTGKIKVA